MEFVLELDYLYHFLFKKKFSLRSLINKTLNRSIYVHGSPGGGKTFLVNLFLQLIEENNSGKKILRIHFQEFINIVHYQVNEMRAKKKINPIKKVSNDIASKYVLICFDELEIVDIADAMIVSRLFSFLINKNIIFVITSNYIPDDLYKHGLQRSQFLPFIDLIKKDMKVINLKNKKDLRKKDTMKDRKYFIFPINEATKKKYCILKKKILKLDKIQSRRLISLGRKIEFKTSTNEALMCNFDYICSYIFSPNDYIKISNTFKWFLIDNIPILGRTKLSEARRFIILIDILYEKKSKVLLRSEGTLLKIFSLGKSNLPFSRTISRISEMTGQAWVQN